MTTTTTGRWRTLLLLGTVSAAGWGCEPAPREPGAGDAAAAGAGTGWSLDAARLLFESRTPAGTTLLVLDRGAETLVALTEEGARNWAGSPSPDGSRLAFLSLRDGNYEIYVSDVAGQGARNVTRHPAFEVLPVWSPDGRRLAFMSTRGYEPGGADGPFPGHVYVVDVTGTDTVPRQVTRTPLTSSLGPTDWSPDGRSLLLSREVDGQIDIYLLDVESGEETRLTSGPAGEYGATFSTGGDRIAFHSVTEGASRIVVMNADGTGQRALTPENDTHYEPRWSPDDAWLLVSSLGGRDGGTEQYDVRAVRVADGTVQALVATPGDERANAWLPLGR